ncbi:MAG: hypothetical protein JW963_03770 [Anaerolineales bacterium]|nr:hypothetical protein [Anaerolineales bacterium]
MRPSRPKWQIELLNYLIDNIFDYLTIAASAYIVIRHQFIPYSTNDITLLTTWMLGILGLLAVSGLWERHRQLRNIQEVSLRTNELVTHKLSGQVNAKDFFWPSERKITGQDIANADDIYVVGMILNRAVRNNLTIFGNRTAVGANIRFVLLDPDDESLMKIMPFRSYGTKSSEWWRNRIKQTVGHIEDIPNIDKPKGSIKIGFLPYFPSFGMWLIDPDKPHGRIVVEIYHHRTAEPNPTFLLKASDDSYWYNFFKSQFDLLWRSCEENGKVVDIITPEVAT